MPPNSTYLTVTSWNGLPADFDEDVQFQCQRGMKFDKDFNQIYQIATCRPDNRWDVPEWGQCVESE